MQRTNFVDGEHGTKGGDDLYEVLPPHLPAAREWSSAFFGLAGLGCLAGCAAFVAERLGLLAGRPELESATQNLASVGATPALLGIGGAILVGLAAGARGRRRQTQAVLDTLAQMPDHGAWLEDLDASLQRLHVSLVTVESRLSGMIEHTANVLEERLARPQHDQGGEVAELGARLMRVGSSVDHLAAGVARLEERAGSRRDEARMSELLERVAQLSARVESLRLETGSSAYAHTAHDDRSGDDERTGTRSEVEDDVTIVALDDESDARPRRELPSVDSVAPPMPRRSAPRFEAEPVVEESFDLDPSSAVDGLPLFAGVEEPVRTPAAAPRARRNPYDG